MPYFFMLSMNKLIAITKFELVTQGYEKLLRK